MNQIKKILITGVEGQVGSSIKNSLRKEFNTVGFNRNGLNISDLKNMRDVIISQNPDMVINPAAYTDVDAAEDNQKEAYLINAIAPGEIAKICSELSIPLIHFSTDYVFDGNKKNPYKENDNPNPKNFYGQSKLDGENLIIKNTKKYFIIRTSWVYSMSGKNFLTTMLKLFKENDELKIVSDQIGSPTSSNFIAEKILKLVRKYFVDNSASAYGIYNLSSSGETNWYEFAKAIHTISAINNKLKIIPISSKEYITRAKRPKMSVLNNDKISCFLREDNESWQDSLKKEFKEISS